MYFHEIHPNKKTSMVPRSTTTDCPNGMFHCGLLCRKDPVCRALMEMNNTTVKAECSQVPGLLQSSTVYILLEEVAIPGND